jgi:pyruvate formate lyase activating enzyme
MSKHLENTSQEEALIFEIKGNSLDDGPGIRTVVFFKGCPLRCVWCHNPESIKREIEISFDKNECVKCDSCIEVCPTGTLDHSAPYFINTNTCTLCMKCIEVCPSEALSQVGRYLTIDDVIKVIHKDLPFFKTSGGGVTLSGGEPTLSMKFIATLLREVKSMGISTLLETCGLFDIETFMKLVYPHLDIIYFDIKLMDETEHRKYCGASNHTILENFQRLYELSGDSGVEILPRIPLIPEITATSHNLTSIASYLHKLGARKVAILPYNPLWLQKLEKIGQSSNLAGKKIMQAWITSDVVKRWKEIFKDFELR